MHTDNQINVINKQIINNLRSSIDDLRDQLYVRELKKDLKEFVDNNVLLHESQNFLKTEIITEAPFWFPKAHLSRGQTDLIATSVNGEEFIFYDYFTNHVLPSIQTENGLIFNGTLIDILAGSMAKGQYAQASSDNTFSIGEVSSITGTANAKRLDGNDFVLSNGDPVFQGDTITVSNSGAVGLTFLDKTTLSLSEGGKMVLDELVYNTETGDGNMAVDIVEGAFSFISGEIAKSGEDAMTIKTPVATIGIRGTTVAGKAAVEGNENSFTLLQDADGGVGQISVSNAGGTQVLGQIGATTSISSFNTPPPPPIILSAAQIQANYGSALNVLPPTPAVAPSPQEPPAPQEEQQIEAQEETTDESEEENIQEEVSDEETASEEESEDNEEGLEDSEEELLEGDDENEETPVVSLDDEQLLEEDSGEQSQEETIEDDQVVAREAFDTALASGATPEEAMAEAAATAGFSDDSSGGVSSTENDVFDLTAGSSSLSQSFTIPGTIDFSENFGTESLLSTGPLNAIQDSVIGTVFGMEPIGEPVFVQSPMELMFDSATGLGDPMLGFLNLTMYESSETETIETYFDDPSLYNDYQATGSAIQTETETETESTETSSIETFTGTSASDTIDKTNSTTPWILDGGDADDILIGGNMDDIIIGGKGSDRMYGGLGDDKFYYRDNDVDVNDFDSIYDFRHDGAGNDQIIAGVSELSSSYSRSLIYNDAQQFGSAFLIEANSGNLPTIFNFTFDYNSSNINSPNNLASTLGNFYVGVNASTSIHSLETYLISVGDGTDTYTYVWEDTSMGGGVDSSELTPIALLHGYNNDNMDGSEFDYQTISGV